MIFSRSFYFRQRVNYNKTQLEILQQEYDNNPFPDISTRETLATMFGVTSQQIYKWFQNRRSRLKYYKFNK